MKISSNFGSVFLDSTQERATLGLCNPVIEAIRA